MLMHQNASGICGYKLAAFIKSIIDKFGSPEIIFWVKILD